MIRATTIAARFRLAIGLLLATSSMAFATPAAAQWVCEEPGYPVNCNDGWCCPGGATCMGGGRCSDGSGNTGNGGTTGGGTCPTSHPVRCEAVGVCCGEGSTCGEEGCCQDIDVQGCTQSLVCSGEPDGYVIVDGARFDCNGDDCSAVEQRVADHCASQQDEGGCAVTPTPAHPPAPIALVAAGGLLIAAIGRARRRRAAR